MSPHPHLKPSAGGGRVKPNELQTTRGDARDPEFETALVSRFVGLTLFLGIRGFPQARGGLIRGHGRGDVTGAVVKASGEAHLGPGLLASFLRRVPA